MESVLRSTCASQPHLCTQGSVCLIRLRRPRHVHAHAQVRVLHYWQLRIEAAHARKVSRAAEQRLVAE